MSAMRFWIDAYAAGVRITYQQDQFIYEQVDPYRVGHTKSFGCFDPQPVADPLNWIVYGAERLGKELIRFLDQPVPKEVRSFWYHPLCLQYEAEPLAIMCAKLGVATRLYPTKLGILPVIEGVRTPDKDRDKALAKYDLPALSGILEKNGYTYARSSYYLLSP